ncbi:MAG: sulfite exporter TauE/SafE family protein [Kurthia sp.]|nr:sulfite exporter TauE/SafE family protein [Candidatus Kurthia equi]
MNTDINLLLAFGAGFLSFISPCTLPLYPAFLSYITGVSFGDLKDGKGMMQKKAILHTLFFLLGFSLVFIALGFGTSLVKTFFVQYDEAIRQFGGILIVIFGLVVSGLFTPKFLMKERKFELKNRPAGYIGSALIGLVFAAGWTPCTGPILAGIMALGISNPDSAVWYMLAYVIGFSIPFFVLSFFISRLNWIRKNSQRFVKVGGYIMIVMGVILFFNGMTLFNRLLSPIFGDFIGF